MNMPTFRTCTLAFAFCMLMEHSALADGLYDAQTFRPLTSDHKAFRVGDGITVLVIEDASASSNADTTTRRKNNLDVALTRNEHRYGAGAEVNGDFDGGGSTARAGKLVAQLSVSVVEVLPNGELRVAGQQQVTVNGEQQRITVEGRVRPADVSTSNAVQSTHLADARITYQGDGELSERQRPGWWRHLLDKLGF